MGKLTSIAVWLENLGLAKYKGAFSEAEVEFEDLVDLTDEDLAEIGLPVGPRRKVRKAIDALGASDEPEEQSAETGPERRHMTVLFVDLVGSSKLSSKLDAEDTREVILAYQNAVSDVIRKPEFNGYVAKFMGDGALCYFGWPTAYEDDAERAVRAGLALVSAVKKLEPLPGISLSCRVGLASGNVVVGDMIGQGASAEHALVGETANIAARLQDLAQANQVIIPESTRRLLGDAFALTSLGQQSLRGISQSTEAFIVTGEDVGGSRFEMRRGGQILPMVGRSKEIETLVSAWDAAQNCLGQSYLISGDAGIGKSRLLRAFTDQLKDDSVPVLSFQCVPHREDSAFHPVINRLVKLVGFTDADTDQQKRDKIRSVSGATGEDIDLFAQFLGVEIPEDSPVHDMTPAKRRTRTNGALLDWTFRATSNSPMVIIFEDLHWIDPTTQELISNLSIALQDKPVLLLTTARLNTIDELLAENPQIQDLRLKRMDAENVSDLVARVAAVENVDPDVVELVVRRTDGVPLFVEELTRSLIENNVLLVSNGRISAPGNFEQRAVPDTLQDILVSRLDSLNLAKRAAQIASCFGREFRSDALAPILGSSEDVLKNSLYDLVASNLVHQIGSAEDGTFRFKHALLRDAAYGTLLKNDRKDIHQQIYSNFVAEQAVAPEVLAYHAKGAGDLQAAMSHYVKASEEAQARPAYLEAIAHLDNAIELLEIARAAVPDAKSKLNETEMGLQAKRAAILMVARGFGAEEVKIGFERALQLSEEFPQSPVRVSIVYGLWVHDFVRGNLRRALVFAEQALAVAVKVQNTSLLVTTNRMKAVILCMMGRFAESEEFMAEAISHFDETAHRGLGETMGQEIDVAVYAYRALNLCFMGRMDASLEMLELGIKVGDASGHYPTICHIYAHAELPALIAGRTDLVRKYCNHSTPLAIEHGIPIWALYGELNYALADLADGDASAYGAVVAAFDAIAALPGCAVMGVYHGLMPHYLMDCGLDSEAREWIDRSVKFIVENGDQAGVGDIALAKARLALKDGKLAEAKEHLTEAFEFGSERGTLAVVLRSKMIGVEAGLFHAKELRAVMDDLQPGDCPHLLPAANLLVAE